MDILHRLFSMVFSVVRNRWSFNWLIILRELVCTKHNYFIFLFFTWNGNFLFIIFLIIFFWIIWISLWVLCNFSRLKFCDLLIEISRIRVIICHRPLFFHKTFIRFVRISKQFPRSNFISTTCAVSKSWYWRNIFHMSTLFILFSFLNLIVIDNFKKFRWNFFQIYKILFLTTLILLNWNIFLRLISFNNLIVLKLKIFLWQFYSILFYLHFLRKLCFTFIKLW